MKNAIYQFVLASIFVFGLVTCAHNIGVVVRSTSDLNNGGNPVVVRVYQLKSAGSFQRATIETFWGKERALLGSDLLGDPIELVLHPNETRTLKGIELNDEAAFIGAAADFYQPDVDQWKSLIDVTTLKSDRLVLAVGKDGLLIQSIK